MNPAPPASPLRKPVLQDEAFLEDVLSAQSADGHFRLWWLGQSGFLLQYQGRHLLLDPYLSDSLTVKYAGTPRPHIRMTARVVDPERLDFIDAVTSSHAHTDHLDPDTLRPLATANPDLALVIPEAIRDLARERSGLADPAILGLDEGQSVTLGEFHLTAVPSAHEQLDRDASGRALYLGYVIRCGRWTLYHCGDTVLYEGLPERLRSFAIDVALLPINGRDPKRGVAGNLDAREAVWLAQQAHIGCVIPCHYEMFTFNTADPAEFAAIAAGAGQAAVVLRCGQRWDSRHLL